MKHIIKFFKQINRIFMKQSIWTRTAIVTGIDEVNGTDKNNDPFNIKGRQSFIFKKENSDWKIIHHHRSKMPE